MINQKTTEAKIARKLVSIFYESQDLKPDQVHDIFDFISSQIIDNINENDDFVIFLENINFHLQNISQNE
jgi:hypothetical protein